MPAPKTKSKEQTRTELLANITTTVKSLFKQEDSTLWQLIKACYQAKAAGIEVPDIRSTLTAAFAEDFDRYNPASKQTHISKICKIAFNCKEEDFERWDKAGIGFYRAYSEFAKPQTNPNDKNWTNPKLREEMTDEEAEQYEKKLEEGENHSPNSLTRVKPDVDKADPTISWAARIDRDPALWLKLLESLAESKCLTAVMVTACFNTFIKGNDRRARDITTSLLQNNDAVAEAAKEFIEENPQMVGSI